MMKFAAGGAKFGGQSRWHRWSRLSDELVAVARTPGKAVEVLAVVGFEVVSRGSAVERASAVRGRRGVLRSTARAWSLY